jgi:hypothetical protein
MNSYLTDGGLKDTYVVVDDQWWGRYTGIVKGPARSYTEPYVNVKILTCLRKPSDRTILYPDTYARRKTYLPGEIHNFPLKNVVPLLA